MRPSIIIAVIIICIIWMDKLHHTNTSTQPEHSIGISIPSTTIIEYLFRTFIIFFISFQEIPYRPTICNKKLWINLF